MSKPVTNVKRFLYNLNVYFFICIQIKTSRWLKFLWKLATLDYEKKATLNHRKIAWIVLRFFRLLKGFKTIWERSYNLKLYSVEVLNMQICYPRWKYKANVFVLHERYWVVTFNMYYQYYQKVINTDHKKLICTYCYPHSD